jgi:hypothetical protein
MDEGRDKAFKPMLRDLIHENTAAWRCNISTMKTLHLFIIQRFGFRDESNICFFQVVPVLNKVPRHEDVRGSGGIAPRNLNLGTTGDEWSASRPGRHTSREKAPCIIGQ